MVARHWLYFGGFVVSGVLLLGAVLAGLLDGLAALSSGVPRSETAIVLTVLAAAAEWVVIVIALGLVAAVFLAATGVSILRNGALPRDDRLVSLVERLEREYPVLRQFDASGRVEPTVEDRKRELKEQYVEGEISNAEFERRMERLMADAEESPPSHHREVVETDERAR